MSRESWKLVGGAVLFALVMALSFAAIGVAALGQP